MIKDIWRVRKWGSIPHTPEIVYTPEEYKTAYDIISEYYDGDVDEFLYSTNIEEKVDFIHNKRDRNTSCLRSLRQVYQRRLYLRWHHSVLFWRMCNFISRQSTLRTHTKMSSTGQPGKVKYPKIKFLREMPWCLGISFLSTAADFRSPTDSIHHDQEDMIQTQEDMIQSHHHKLNIYQLKKIIIISTIYCKRKICISHFFVVSLY